MAELRTNFTQKAGYENKLDFDPVKGIIKYGNYEAFLYQIPEIIPQTKVVNYEDWKNDYLYSLKYPNGNTGYGSAMQAFTFQPPSEAELRAKWDTAFVTGAVDPTQELQPAPTGTGGTFGGTMPGFGVYTGALNTNPGYRQVKKLGADSYEIKDYYVPGDVELLYKMNQLAMGTTQITEDRALMQEQAATKRARAANAQSAATSARLGTGAAMMSASAASRALSGG